jgi:glycosyltransferase involved in cell wall biosynthesis
MKLLIFAHTPPPHHGQSYMVKLMLEGFGGDQRKAGAGKAAGPPKHGICCYHVNARVSKELEDVGSFQILKIFLLLGHCLHAIWCRVRYGVSTMYYIPAPGKKSALYRDWMVMFLCRPFYKKIILHWHAAGLAKWLETHVQVRTRSITYRRMKAADLSIVLSRYNRADAEKLVPRQIRVVNNGIPDPCPNFERDILPRRLARLKARAKLVAGQELSPADLDDTGGDPQVFKVLYLAHCTRDKGLFDVISGALLASRNLAANASRLSLELIVAGSFFDEDTRAEFDNVTTAAKGQLKIRYLGFVSGAQKQDALRDADFFCFPTYFQNENQPVSLIEAMAFGLPILTSRWRSIPELFPADYSLLVDICSPEQISRALQASFTADQGQMLREIFMRQFNLEQYLTALAEAFLSVDSGAVQPETQKAPLRRPAAVSSSHS